MAFFFFIAIQIELTTDKKLNDGICNRLRGNAQKKEGGKWEFVF